MRHDTVQYGFQMLRRNAEDRCNTFLRNADKFPADWHYITADSILHTFHHDNFELIYKFLALCLLQNGDDSNKNVFGTDWSNQ